MTTPATAVVMVARGSMAGASRAEGFSPGAGHAPRQAHFMGRSRMVEPHHKMGRAKAHQRVRRRLWVQGGRRIPP